MDSFDVLKLLNMTYQESQIACALIELEAMKVANLTRERDGQSPAYREEAFMALIDKYQLSHNAVLTNLYSGL